MYREIKGYGNPHLDKKFFKQEHISHVKRLNMARIHGSSEAKFHADPRTLKPLSNAKAVAMDEERVCSIEKQNQKLFERMQRIELNPSKLVSDSINDPHRHDHMFIGRIEGKRRQMEQIQAENLKILNRLQNVSPSVNFKKFYKDRVKNERTLDSLCKYPHLFKSELSH